MMKNVIDHIRGISLTHKLFIAIASGIIFISEFSMAQVPNNLNITFRPGANFPVKDLGETKLSNGGGFEVTFAYMFMQNLQAYGGWGWNSFREMESNVDSELQFEETGYAFGLQFIHPLSSESKLSFMLGGGGIYNHIETENEEGDIIDDTNHGLGWQAEAGLSIPVGHHNRWNLIPTVRYHALSRNITNEGITTSVDLNYISAVMGVSWTVWSAEK